MSGHVEDSACGDTAENVGSERWAKAILVSGIRRPFYYFISNLFFCILGMKEAGSTQWAETKPKRREQTDGERKEKPTS